MYFLCLHGLGTNSSIFEMQTSAIRFELGDNHTYEFVEGVIPWSIAPEAEHLFSETDEAFAYFDPMSVESYRTALVQLEEFIAIEGPFDGVIGFSQGAMLAAALMIRKYQEDPAGQHLAPLFKCAIFFSGLIPYTTSSLLLDVPEAKPFTNGDVGGIIGVPTAHIWGAQDLESRVGSRELSKICKADRRSVFIHDGGHEIPGLRTKTGIASSVKMIRRAIDLALIVQ